VKPTLDKLGLLEESDQEEDSLTAWDATLSKALAELVRGGHLLYSDLNITDNSRKRQNPHQYYSNVNVGVFGYQITISPYPNILLCTEKDTTYELIKDIAQLLGCSCISSKGQNSLAAMEDLIRGIKVRWESERMDNIFVVTLTDYDPAGYYIADAMASQVEDMLKALNFWQCTGEKNGC
jgi:hypothetical protein